MRTCDDASTYVHLFELGNHWTVFVCEYVCKHAIVSYP